MYFFMKRGAEAPLYIIKMPFYLKTRYYLYEINGDLIKVIVKEQISDEQIKYYLEQTPKYTREDSEAFVDLMLELEAKKDGQTYFVEQQEMELYRSCINKDRVREAIFMLTLLCYDSDCYTKEVHEMVMAEEAEETKKN